MRFSEFCDMAENTEQEQQLLQFFKQGGMEIPKKIFARMSYIPIMGKVFTALIAIGNYKSIAEFRQTAHYRNLMNWNFAIDFDKKNLSINPNDEQIKKARKIMLAIAIGVALLVICRKLCCRKK